MATNNLEVKFKVDASEVTRGSEDAKNKVKNAANEMASDVKNSSRQMEASMKDVSRATEGIGEATKTATTAVKQMEGQVNASAKSMEKSIDDVSKKMNVMMGARAAATGARMLGSAIQSIGPSLGMDETTASKTSGVLTGAASGIAMGAQLGTVIGGPGIGTGVGAAVGGLIGAGASLLKAGQELQKAAASEQEKQAIRAEQVRQMREEDASRKNMAKWDDMSLEELRKDRAERAVGIENYKRDLELLKAGLDPNTVTDQDLRKVEFSTNRIVNLQQKLEALDKYISDVEADEAEAKRVKDEEYQKNTEELNAKFAIAQANTVASQFRNAHPEQWARMTGANTVAGIFEGPNADVLQQHKYISELEEREKKAKEEKNKNEDEKENPLKGAFTASSLRQTDSLTRIGGGNGYASYNNSTAQIQKNIETSLKTLISNQKNQNDQIIQKLDEFKNLDFTTTWE